MQSPVHTTAPAPHTAAPRCETAHTPAPWTLAAGAIWGPPADGDKLGRLVLSPIDPELLADIKAGHWDDIAAPRDADLQLMASAPALAKWLDWALCRLLEHGFDGDDDNFRAAEAAPAAASAVDQDAIDAQQAQLRG